MIKTEGWIIKKNIVCIVLTKENGSKFIEKLQKELDKKQEIVSFIFELKKELKEK